MDEIQDEEAQKCFVQIMSSIEPIIQPICEDIYYKQHFLDLERYYYSLNGSIGGKNRAGIIAFMKLIINEEVRNYVLKLLPVFVQPDVLQKVEPFYILSVMNVYKQVDFVNKLSDMLDSQKVECITLLENIFTINGHVLSELGQGKYIYNLVYNRMLLHLDYLHTIRLLYDQYLLFPTKGDFHRNMWNPVIMIEKTTKEAMVLKPRDMMVDVQVAETIMFMRDLLGKDVVQLPDVKIKFPKESEGSAPFSRGVMEKVTKCRALDEERAKNYFRQLGSLLFITELFGIGDMHYENIMATGKGPVIIDSEVAFQCDILYKNSWNDGALGFLVEAIHTMDETANVIPRLAFNVKSGDEKHQSMMGAIHEGFSTMVARIVSESKAEEMLRKNQIADYFLSIIKKPISVRLVPVATNNFYGCMQSYWQMFDNEGTKACIVRDCVEECLLTLIDMFSGKNDYEPLKQRICNELNDCESDMYSPYGVPDKEESNQSNASIKFEDIEIKPSILAKRIAWDFLLATIPIVTLNISTGEVFIDGEKQEFMKISRIETTLTEGFKSHVDWMLSKECYTEFQDRFKILKKK